MLGWAKAAVQKELTRACDVLAPLSETLISNQVETNQK